MVAPVVVAVFVVGALYAAERGIPRLTATLGIETDWLGRQLSRAPNADSYDALLGTVAGVAGVFLALYFTALSTVAANVYTTVPHDIRQLIVRDRLGNVYVKAVAFLTALAVLLLATRALGLGPFRLAPPLLFAVGGYGIFSFIKLGQRAFYLADPTLLANNIASDAIDWTRRSTISGWRWSDANFQAHYRRGAVQCIDSLVSLTEISSRTAHLQGASRRRLVFNLVHTLHVYERDRGKIPLDSRWFGERYEHKQWYLVDGTELDLAMNTASSLTPKLVADNDWFEDRLLGAIESVAVMEAREGKIDEVGLLAQDLPKLWDRFGNCWQIELGVRWGARFTGVTVAELAESSSAEADEFPAMAVGISDALAMLPIWLELGFMRAIDALDVATLRTRLEGQDWSKPDRAYVFGLPPRAVSVLEDIRQNLTFERQAKSSSTAPNWYIAEIAMNSTAWAIHDGFDAVLAHIEVWYAETAKRLSEASLHEAAAAVDDRAYEVAWKLDRHIGDLRSVAEALVVSRAGLKRPEWDWDATAERIEAFRSSVITRMAASIPALKERVGSTEVPDYLGATVHRTGEACFEASAECDTSAFSKLFGLYFIGSLEVFDRVRSQVGGWEQNSAFTLMADPVMDLLHLSGYAMVFAELYDEPTIWDSCRSVWDRYLGGERGREALATIAGVIQLQRHVFMLAPRAPQRSRWQMRLGEKLNALPRRPPASPFAEPAVEHESALIRQIAPSFAFLARVDGLDVFVARYLAVHPSADGIDFGGPHSLDEDDAPAGDRA